MSSTGPRSWPTDSRPCYTLRMSFSFYFDPVTAFTVFAALHLFLAAVFTIYAPPCAGLP